MNDIVLEVEDLKVSFLTNHGWVVAIDGFSMAVESGKTTAIVGESGSGKTVTAMTVMGLHNPSRTRIDRGTVKFQGETIVGDGVKRPDNLNGRQISMIFQDSLSALNPVFSVGWQIAEMFRIHKKMSRKDARREAIRILDNVGIPDPEKRFAEYPHQFSGGMRQRAMIGMGIALSPSLLIADEPTTALDVTVQAQVLDLIQAIQAEMGMGVLLITHDLGVVEDRADFVHVMYSGREMESAAPEELFSAPTHPYTRGLLASSPHLDDLDKALEPIPGRAPSLENRADGCPFHPRCAHAVEECKVGQPPGVTEVREGHQISCLRLARGDRL